ncbi:SbcC/MukB-like Walker B domain-containing protein [Rossellomorea sp. BNER]|uniref:SbcC/MukB-like Walker B domain-containing protein n=1 Tax=Rossellomorea sp. BNER TaxID=2962031 RepID=UPI003AF27083|nr:SMC family ATPase [Rossellomorea sp. BNER]
MKPLKLIMQAFGPYAGEETIDFESLENRTMFVISGKTGSGKTTIFDGISYAIYGKASGEDRNGTDLRSQFANDDMMTEVSLDFSLRGKTYHIWRSPQQEKKKARGDGFTTINARAELYVFSADGEKQILGSNVREVEEKIKAIMQLDANQFRQILMIPQGEFRKLLTSESKDKELILQRLFHTEYYKAIQEQLKEESDELKQSVEKSMETRTRLLRNLQFEENELLKEELLAPTLNDKKIIELLHPHLEQMKKELERMKVNFEKKQNERDGLQKKIIEAESLLEQFKLRDQLRTEQKNLDIRKASIDEKKKEISRAHKAARLLQQDEYCHKLKRDLDSIKKEELQLKTSLEELKKKLEKAEYQWNIEKEKETERANAVKKVNRLETMQKDVYSFSHLQQQVLQLEKQLAHEKTSLEKLQSIITNSKQQLIDKEKQKEELENVREQLLAKEKELSHNETIEKQLRIVKNIDGEVRKLDQLSKDKKVKHDHILSRVEDARQTLQHLEEKWRRGQAGILAMMLKDEHPCPVCGSTHHPEPERSQDDLPLEGDLKAAKDTLTFTEKEEVQAGREFYEVDAKHKAREEALEQSISDVSNEITGFTLENLGRFISETEQKKKELQLFIKEANEQCSALTPLRNQLLQIKEKLTESEENYQQGMRKFQDLRDLFTNENAKLENLKETIPEEIRSKESFDRTIQQAQNNRDALQKAFEAAQSQFHRLDNEVSVKVAQVQDKEAQIKTAIESLNAERQTFLKLLEEQGFDNYRSFHDAKRTDDQITLLEKEVQLYGEELRSVTDRLKDLERNLENTEMPELANIKTEFSHVSKELQTLNEHANEQRNKIKENERIRELVLQVNEDMKEFEERFKLVGHLAEMARGQNAHRITFERYVLASFLEEILRVANNRLTKMTSGRFQLIRKRDRSKGNVQSGLELLVFDQYTGQERHVKTLSGGESFKAALALALGLADVVQQYAGGVSLETMFIDEGFGTLDPESLDHAIEALMDIQSSGRLVGIISHVPELKERIDARLEVISTQVGSRTEFQFLA